VPTRQQVLFLYLASSALDTRVVAWSSYDGAGEGPTPPVEADPTPPYATGVDALRDGWRLLQASPLQRHLPGHERDTDFLLHEFIFERLVETSTT
jgi:hypothetical protein